MTIGTYLNFVLALAFVLGLIGLAAWAYRRFATGRGLAQRLSGKAPRLEIVEVRAVDARRRLVLVRRDSTEHLLLLGPTGEIVVERNIAPAAAAATAADTGGP